MSAAPLGGGRGLLLFLLLGALGRRRLALALLAGVATAHPLLLARRPTDLVGQRLALLVEVVAEVVGEAGDGVAQRLLDLVGPFAVADLLEQVWRLGVQALGQLARELGHPADGDALAQPVR